MYELNSSHEQRRFERTLKSFAFYESPEFKSNIIQAMGVTRKFQEIAKEPYKNTDNELVEVPLDASVEISFEATRLAYSSSPDGKPDYLFKVNVSAFRDILPYELQLSASAVRSLAENLGLTDLEDEMPENVVREEVDRELREYECPIEVYQWVESKYRTNTGDVTEFYGHGYEVDGERYDDLSTYPVEGSGSASNTEAIPDPIEAGLNNLLYTELINGGRLPVAESKSGTLLPVQDRMQTMLWAVSCLRARRLN